MESELSRIVKVRPLPGPTCIEASEAERLALAERFGINEVRSLVADLELEAKATSVAVNGRLQAEIVQDCAVSGDPFATTIEEPIDLRFVEAEDIGSPDPDKVIEVDLNLSDSDEIEYEGDSFDLGEAVAQTLGLAIDPFAEGPEANAVRAKVGLEEPTPDSPFAALAGLKKS